MKRRGPVNLLKETIDDLKEHGKSLEDIQWVGDRKLIIPTEQFLKLADVEYDDGNGDNEIYRELLVVGSDWWLERQAYGNDSWWEFKQLPKKPDKACKVLGITMNQDENVFFDGLKAVIS